MATLPPLDPFGAPFARELEVARALALEAGAAIMTHYHDDMHVEFKDKKGTDPVTQADKDANEIIVRGLAQAFPGDAILAEESPDPTGRMANPRLWCVDPLDGTRDYVEQNGMFVVMIGLAIHGEARVGVVYQPTENALYAGAGRTAWVERRGAIAPLVPTREDDPGRATMVVSRSHRSATVSKVAQTLGVRGERPLGSVGLKVAAVASGEAEIYLSTSTRTHEWDACGPDALLRAAGGLMTDVRGEPLRYNKRDTTTPFGMLATNGALHHPSVQALVPVVRERGWA